MANGRCGDCHFYDKSKQVCNNPSRDDSKCVHYHSHLDPNDYCALFMPAVNLGSVNNAETKNTSEQV